MGGVGAGGGRDPMRGVAQGLEGSAVGSRGSTR